MKKRIKSKDLLNEPAWYKFYDNIPRHLNYPNYSLYKMIEKSAEKRPKAIAYNYFGIKCTYKKFMEKIDSVSRSLKVLGVKEDDRVTICMPNTPEAIQLFYAVNKIGAICNMIHPLSAENEIKYFLDVSESKYLFTIDLAWARIKQIIQNTDVEKMVILSVKNSMPKYMQVAYNITTDYKIKKPKYDEKFINWQTFIEKGKDYKHETFVTRVGSQEAVILYSGGTTGRPKGIMLSNLAFNANSLEAIEAVNCLKEGDKVLSIMPIFHGFGLSICIHTAFAYGYQAILLPQFNAKKFHKLISKYKPNIIAGVPTLYEALLNNKQAQKAKYPFLKCAISGGDSLSINLKIKIDKFFVEHGANIQVREGYGLTECLSGTCLTPKDYYREGSIGIPYPDQYYKIVKPGTIKEVPYGTVGEITIFGPSNMMYYVNNPEETKKTLIKHKDGNYWLHTGDLGFMDEDGFIYYKQRSKRMIISSGYNVYPQQIENVIDQHPAVLVSCVVGVKHAYKQEVAKAFVALKQGIEPTEQIRAEIMELCIKNLSKFALPYEIEFRSELPKTLIGKVAYTKLIENEEFSLKKD